MLMIDLDASNVLKMKRKALFLVIYSNNNNHSSHPGGTSEFGFTHQNKQENQVLTTTTVKYKFITVLKKFVRPLI